MTCPLCLTPLTNPITLPCGQIICSDCVDSLLLGGSEMECLLLQENITYLLYNK
ncbi:hypothetical protein ENUP19_0128G0031 [Entamoeba nuttalli]|uniref:RING-type domain-containing protein n=1 Tax=Entamoeba nuttalli TaxID=412467 RepID=A0ABQ0DJL6_9EUKA